MFCSIIIYLIPMGNEKIKIVNILYKLSTHILSGFGTRINRFLHAIRYLLLRVYFGHVLIYCSSMSYTLLVSFIPLVASMSLFAGKIYELNRTKIQLFLSQKEISALMLKFLPYSSHTLDLYILKILKNASTVGWIGTAVFFFAVIGLYSTIEEIFNVTWHIRKGRSLPKKIGMIFLIFVLLGGAFTLYVKIGNLPILNNSSLLYIIAKTGAFLLVTVAFSILYKLIPKTRVEWRASFYGGLFAVILYEICRNRPARLH